VEKCGRSRQATDGTTKRCMCFACWITKATNTHSEYIILVYFHNKNEFAKAPKYYVYTYLSSTVFASLIFLSYKILCRVSYD